MSKDLLKYNDINKILIKKKSDPNYLEPKIRKVILEKFKKALKKNKKMNIPSTASKDLAEMIQKRLSANMPSAEIENIINEEITLNQEFREFMQKEDNSILKISNKLEFNLGILEDHKDSKKVEDTLKDIRQILKVLSAIRDRKVTRPAYNSYSKELLKNKDLIKTVVPDLEDKDFQFLSTQFTSFEERIALEEKNKNISGNADLLMERINKFNEKEEPTTNTKK